ncbi:MAG: phage terminase large subunit [Alphaproteobacteria bacterium]
MMTTKVDFLEFVWIWNKAQGLEIPKHQRIIVKWLTKIWHSKKREALLMAFRNSGKSTIVGLFCAWVLLQNSDLRILVMAADQELARKMVRNIKRIIERHDLTRHLIPLKKEQWGKDSFIIARRAELRDPSVLARGLGGNITGSRADIIICDDIEVPKNSDTSFKRKDLREKLKELDYIITPKGMVLYIGTPHTFNTIYQTEKDKAHIDNEPFLLGFDKLQIPILDESGQSSWPERFSLSRIAAIRRRNGEKSFLSQMMLEPVNITDGRLDVENLVIFDNEIETAFSQGKMELKLGDKRLVSASCWWDPAYGVGANKGDGSVIACVFTAEDGSLWLYRVRYLEVNADDSDKAASIQCQKVASFASRYFLPSIRIEKNGIGRFLPGILRQKLAKAGVACSVIEENSRKAKDIRIMEAFDALLADKALNVHKSVLATPFVEEMRNWVPGGKGRDDGLDAVAGCISSEPIRIKAYGRAASKGDWRGCSGNFEAETNFEV